jgi:hypothetical protein
MKPLERTQTEIIHHLEKIVLEQNRRLQEANQMISNLKRELEINDEFTDFQMQQLIENFEETVANLLTPSMN